MSTPRPFPWTRGGRLLVAVALLAAGCAEEATPMPTVAAVQEAVERDAQPALYQLLYDAPVLPRSNAEHQRVRMLIWLRHMDLGESQLDQLAHLRQTVLDRTEQIAGAERAVAARYQEEEDAIYRELWDRLSAGAPGDAPELLALTERLAALQQGSERERELLTTRIEGIRSVMDAGKPFLATLSPRQEALLADALFFLRNHLDPVGNPGDFRALVGTTYEPGQYAVLTRGSSRWARQPLNIGGLWSDEPPLAGGALHEARREVLLYLAVLEPGMDEAIAAAQELLAKELDLELVEEVEDQGADEGEVPPAEGEAQAPLDQDAPPPPEDAPPQPDAAPPPGAPPPPG